MPIDTRSFLWHSDPSIIYANPVESVFKDFEGDAPYLPKAKADTLREVNAELYINLVRDENLKQLQQAGLPTFPAEFWGYFDCLHRIIVKEKTNNIILLHWQGKRICFYNDQGDDFDKKRSHIIEIDNCQEIADLMAFMANVMDGSEVTDQHVRYRTYQRIAEKILRDIPIEDLASPARHVRRIVHHFILDSFNSIDETWGSVGEVKVRRHTTGSEEESIFELNFAMGGEEEPSFEEQLPTVRYGFTEADEARIYAVQTPRYKGMSKKNATEEISSIASINRLKTLLENLEDWQRRDPEQFISLFGEGFDKEKLSRDLEAFHSCLPESKTSKMLDAAFESNEIVGINLDYQFASLERRYKATKALQHFEMMDAKLAKIKDYFRDGLPAKLRRGVAPAMVMSLCVTMHLLNKVGVKEVVIPLRMPLREKLGAEGEVMNAKISDQMARLAHRVVLEVEGLEIVEDNSTIRIKMAEDIHFKSSGVRKALGLEEN